MQLLTASSGDIDRAARAIAEGLLVAIPTETVYGLGADAFDAVAVARIFEAKARPFFDPLIVHIADLSQVASVAPEPDRRSCRLMETLWPGPLTLVLRKAPRIPDLVTSGLPTVALRLPAHPVAREIIRRSGTAVAAPSANPFGYLSPTTAAHVVAALGDRVDYVLDAGPCAVGVESTILDMTSDPPAILRQGGTPRSAIEAVVGPVSLRDRTEVLPDSPGQLENHYAPRTGLVLLPEGCFGTGIPGSAGAFPPAQGTRERPGDGDGAGSVCGTIMSADFPAGGTGAVALAFDERSRRAALASGLYREAVCLSGSGDLREAAARLFSVLHDLDASGFGLIVAERVPDAGLGPAINDRLYRASKKAARPV